MTNGTRISLRLVSQVLITSVEGSVQYLNKYVDILEATNPDTIRPPQAVLLAVVHFKSFGMSVAVSWSVTADL